MSITPKRNEIFFSQNLTLVYGGSILNTQKSGGVIIVQNMKLAPTTVVLVWLTHALSLCQLSLGLGTETRFQ